MAGPEGVPGKIGIRKLSIRKPGIRKRGSAGIGAWERLSAARAVFLTSKCLILLPSFPCVTDSQAILQRVTLPAAGYDIRAGPRFMEER
ncbi:MAG: hypothetical protein KJ970_03105 [Candidatus Eisenbacteria bacterium]|uniref:Uncharacterized protein n=1 Tax=Eiseniibacteriota bacterium TaxID=2212470 RepID=A0A948W507_UNCEI|nr:hypothetical protein [Candidatus Eisenbacteria bacterium]